MRYRVEFGAVFLAVAMISAPAYPIQIGPEIRVGPDEFTIGGAGVKDGKVKAPTPDEVVDTLINSTPLAVLSDADKKNVKGAIVTTGYVSAFLSDPITSIVLITVFTKNGEKSVPVPVKTAVPSGIEWAFKSKCIVQQPDGHIMALFVDTPDKLKDIKIGDKLNLTADVCPEYQDKSVTSVTINYSGRSDYPEAPAGEIKHYIVGKTA